MGALSGGGGARGGGGQRRPIMASKSAAASPSKAGSFKQPAADSPPAALARKRRPGRVAVPAPKPSTSVKGTQTKPASEPKRARPSKPERTSALDAAATVLSSLSGKAAAEGLTAGELIERMGAEKLWTSPGGKTPSATLYAAIVREITLKGKEARFSRPGPGRFALAGATVKKSKTPATSAKPAKAAKA